MLKSNVYLLTGAPATGKNTVAQELRRFFPKSFFLDIDLLRSQIGQANMQAHDDDYLQALRIVAQTVNYLLQNKLYLPIFVIDALSPKRFDFFTALIQGQETITKIILWLDNDLLNERITERQGHFFDDWNTTQKMNNWFEELKEQNREDIVFIDRSNQDAQSTARLIWEKIAQ